MSESVSNWDSEIRRAIRAVKTASAKNPRDTALKNRAGAATTAEYRLGELLEALTVAGIEIQRSQELGSKSGRSKGKIKTVSSSLGYKELKSPILKAIENMNGEAHLETIFSRIEKDVLVQLKPVDLEPVGTPPKPRWKVTVQSVLTQLKKEEFVASGHKRGYWKLDRWPR